MTKEAPKESQAMLTPALTPGQLMHYLDQLVRKEVRLSTMIWGPPGVGKSSIVAQTAETHHLDFIDVRLSQLAPTDLRGLPVAENGISRWYPPEFLPRAGKGILFLDELNMAPPAMQGVAQQLILDRKVGSYCYDDQTRVMTRHGLKYFRELAPDDEVMTLNPDTHMVEYHIPQQHIELSYKGDMLHFQGKCHSLCVSPDHNMYIRADWDQAYRFMKAADLAERGSLYHYRVKRTGDWPEDGLASVTISASQREIDRIAVNDRIALLREAKLRVVDIAVEVGLPVHSVERRLYYGIQDPRNHYNQTRTFAVDDWAEFMGWYVTEGSASKMHNYRVNIAQSRSMNPEKYQRIRNLLERMQLRATADEKGFVIHSAALYEYLKPLGRSVERFIPDEVKQLPKHALARFLEAALLGDGTDDRRILTASTKLRDDYCEIAIKLGYGATFSWREGSGYATSENGVWVIGLSQIQDLEAGISKVDRKPYDGTIYCVNVQNHVIMVERDGKLVWCGNCVPDGWFIWAAGNRKEDRASVYDMPTPLANRFVHLTVTPDADSFKDYALSHSLHEQIIAFVAYRPELLHKLDPQQPSWPSPRSWEMASHLHTIELDIAPVVGYGAASEFRSFLSIYRRLPDIDRILEGRGAAIEFPREMFVRYAITIGVAMRAQEQTTALHAFRWMADQASAEWVQTFVIDMFRVMGGRGKIGLVAMLVQKETDLKPFFEKFQELL